MKNSRAADKIINANHVESNPKDQWENTRMQEKENQHMNDGLEDDKAEEFKSKFAQFRQLLSLKPPRQESSSIMSVQS